MTLLDGELNKAFDNGAELEIGAGYDFRRPLKAVGPDPVSELIAVKLVADPGTGVPYVIASDAIALLSTSPDVQIDTQGAAATDDLSTITLHEDMGIGSVIVLRSTDNARDPTVKHNVGNIVLNSVDCPLTTTATRLALMWSGLKWRELWRHS